MAFAVRGAAHEPAHPELGRLTYAGAPAATAISVPCSALARVPELTFIAGPRCHMSIVNLLSETL